MDLQIFPTLFLLLSVSRISAIPVDNNVEGEPEIECGPNSIAINFNTRNDFEGNVFVKGLFNQEECRNHESGVRVAVLELPFDSCNVQRTRSLNPLGVFVSTVVVISFHPLFITKVDRAYRVQCFYMEADKTVSTDIEVSMLTTAFLTLASVPMPVCRYEILDGPTGDIIKYAFVGQPVYHKWTCDTETEGLFCMTVHTCFVDDGESESVALLDESGCAQDRYLLRNLEYLTDLMAGQETHVFKYADRSQLFFNCQISITIKEPDSECEHPQCSEPDRGRKRRALANDYASQPEGILDVRAEMQSLDLNPTPATASQYDRLANTLSNQHQPSSHVSAESNSRSLANNYCLAQSAIALILGLIIILLFIATSSTTVLFYKKQSKGEKTGAH